MALLTTHFDAQTLDLSVGMNIILPDHPDAWLEPPAVLYLLHGLSDDFTMWCRRTAIERHAARYPLAIVMPDVHKSFYCNMVHGSRYWDFVAEELPSIVSRFFNVSNAYNKTFVAGLSMGGYGAMKLALHHPERFSHAASLSGALDVAAHIEDDFNAARTATFEAIFGNLKCIPNSSNDLIHILKRLKSSPDTQFYLTCGTEDYLYPDTVSFKNAAEKANLNLTYHETTGDHTWDYWDTHIQDILQWLPIERIEHDGDCSIP